VAAIDGTSGIVETIATEAQHETSAAQNASAKAKITTFAKSAQKFTYQVTDGGLLPGQLQEVTYAPFGLSATEMLIESINITAVGEDVRYLVTCIVGPVTGSWAKFFSNMLVRQDLTLQVGDGQLLALLQQVESLALVEATAIRTNAFPPDVSIFIALPPAQGEMHHVRHEALALAEATRYLINQRSVIFGLMQLRPVMGDGLIPFRLCGQQIGRYGTFLLGGNIWLTN